MKSNIFFDKKNQRIFFVSGITGHVGGAAAEQLIQDGHKVRTLSRNPQKAVEWSNKGVDVREGDLSDPHAVATALEGVEAAFLIIPPILAPGSDYSYAKTVINSYCKALYQVSPQRLVLLSSIGSEQASGLGNITATHLLEEALSDLSVPTASVRAGSFIENYTYGLKQAESTGLFSTFLTPTSRKVPMIATQDIGIEVSRLLTNAWVGKKILELGSPISPDDLAHAMSELIGRPVKAQSIPREQWPKTLEYMGLPLGSTGPYEEMMDGFNSGWISFGVPGTESIAGKITPAQVFEKYREVEKRETLDPSHQASHVPSRK